MLNYSFKTQNHRLISIIFKSGLVRVWIRFGSGSGSGLDPRLWAACSLRRRRLSIACCFFSSISAAEHFPATADETQKDTKVSECVQGACLSAAWER